MSEAMQLFETPDEPRLTDRQAHALNAIREAGAAGLHTDELGAAVHAFTGKHASDTLCEWCPQAGIEVGRALRQKGLAQQRRRKAPGGDTVTVWTVAGKLPRAVPDPPVDDSDIPF